MIFTAYTQNDDGVVVRGVVDADDAKEAIERAISVWGRPRLGEALCATCGDVPDTTWRETMFSPRHFFSETARLRRGELHSALAVISARFRSRDHGLGLDYAATVDNDE